MVIDGWMVLLLGHIQYLFMGWFIRELYCNGVLRGMNPSPPSHQPLLLHHPATIGFIFRSIKVIHLEHRGFLVDRTFVRALLFTASQTLLFGLWEMVMV